MSPSIFSAGISRRNFLAGVTATGLVTVLAPKTAGAADIGNFAVGGLDPSHILAFTADKIGAFKDSGLEVEILNSQSGPRTKQVVAAKQAFAGLAGAIDPISVTIAGKETVLVAGIDRKATYCNVLVHKDNYDAGIRSIEDLSGQMIGVTQPQSASWLMAKYMTERAGLQDKVEVRALGDLTTMLGGLKSKQVGASMGTLSMVDQAVNEGFGVPIFDITDDAGWTKYFGGDMPGVGVYMMRDAITEQPEETQAFVSGLVKAQDFLLESSVEEIIDAVYADYLSGIPVETIKRALAKYKGGLWLKDNIITEDAYNRLTSIMGGGRQYSDADMAKVPYATSVDMSFVRKARGIAG